MALRLRVGRPSVLSAESLEWRRMLSAAPVGVDDAYDLGPDHRLSVDVAAPPGLPAFDLSTQPPSPAPGPFTIPEFMLTLENGERRTEPDWFEVAEAPNTFAEVTIRDPGSLWRVNNWLAMGDRGRATVLIEDGGTLSVGNFLELADRGAGTITVRDGGRLRTENWTGVAAAESSTRLDGGVGAVLVTGAGSNWTSVNHVTLGANGGRATLDVEDGASMLLQSWLSAGYGPRSRGTVTLSGGGRLRTAGHATVGVDSGTGTVRVTGPSSWWSVGDHVTIGDNRGRGEMTVTDGGVVIAANWSMIGEHGAAGAVTISGAGSRWTVGGQLYVGQNGGRGVLNIDDGGVVTAGNWVEIGHNDGSDGRVIVGGGSTFSFRNTLFVGASLSRTSRGTLYVAEGGSVTNAGGQGYGRGPEVVISHGGRLFGSGSVKGIVNNYGFLSPGGSIGVLTIDGNLLHPAANAEPFREPNPDGVVQFDIGGTRRGTDHDALDVTGRVDFSSGQVVLNFVNGFAPRAGDRFELIDFGTNSNEPRNVDVRGLAPGFQYRLAIEGDRLVLTATNDGVSAPVTVRRKGVLANDTDADGDALTAVLAERPRHGTVTLYRDGSFAYVPGPTFSGADSFAYAADDGVFTSQPATVTFRNLPPAARDDAYATDEDAPLAVPAAGGVLANDSDAVSTALGASLVQGPGHGTLTLTGDGSFTYTPAPDFAGTDSFTYRAGDGQVQSAAATVTITVHPVNDNPVTVADSRSVREGKELVVGAAELVANDTDVDGDALAVTGVSPTADTHGTVSLSRGRISYRPDRRHTGPASFTYTVSDGRGGTADGTVHVTVLPKQRGKPGAAVGAGLLAGGRRHFGLVVVARDGADDLAISGTVTFRDPSRLALRSTDIDRFEIGADGRSVTIGGAATVDGRAGYHFELTAADDGRSGHGDRFRIRVTGPGGFTYDSGAADRVARGNIVVTRRRDDD